MNITAIAGGLIVGHGILQVDRRVQGFYAAAVGGLTVVGMIHQLLMDSEVSVAGLLFVASELSPVLWNLLMRTDET